MALLRKEAQMIKWRPKSCGRVGRLSRGLLRDLVQEKGVEGGEALKAIKHIEKCEYCRFSIELAIKRAEKEGRRTNYLSSFEETLLEAKRHIGVGRVSRERSF